jgi:hypothetical protein
MTISHFISFSFLFEDHAANNNEKERENDAKKKKKERENARGENTEGLGPKPNWVQSIYMKFWSWASFLGLLVIIVMATLVG